MALSGVSTYNNTAYDIVLSAIRKMGFLAEGETPTAQMVNDAASDLNRLVKAWQAQGYHLWTIQEAILFLNPGQAKYTLGPVGSNAVLTANLISPTTTTTVAAGATVISVSSITGITSGMAIGVCLANNTIFWSTVNGAPSGALVTLSTALPYSSNSGSQVYAYTGTLTRPARIVQARIIISNTNEIEMTPISDTDYFMQSNKLATGVPTQYYYQPDLYNGTLYLWTTAESTIYTVKFTYESELQDVGVITNNLQFPQEWLRPLVWNLAKEIMTEFGVDQLTSVMIKTMAEESLEEALSFDQENASVIFQPYPNYSHPIR